MERYALKLLENKQGQKQSYSLYNLLLLLYIINKII